MSIFNADFTGVSDSTLLTALPSPWLGSGSVTEILSEVLQANTTNDFSTNYAPTSPATADQEVAFTCGGSTGNTVIGVALRLSTDGQNCYFAYFDGSWRIGKRVGGTITIGIGTAYAGDVPDPAVACVFSVIGNSISLSINGTERVTATDSDISATGEWGVFSYYAQTGITRYIDNLAYSDVVVDVTAPIISAPTATKTGQSTATGMVDTDEQAGTLHYLVNTNAGAPNAAVVSNGISQSIEAQVTQSISISGLTPSTLYYIHYVQVDPAGNLSTTANSSSFTTDSLSLSVDTTPASITPNASATIIIADPATTPTTENTTLNFVGDSVDASITNVANDGDGLYSISFTFNHNVMPDIAYGLHTLVVTIADESANSSGLQFVPPAGYAAILITDVSNSDLGASAPALAVADQVEYETTEDDIALAIDANAVATVTASNSATPNNEQFSIRAWDATDNSWGAWAVYVAVNDEADPATVAPTITPTAGTTLALDVGDSYADPAWTWADDVISGQAVIWSGDVVDTAVAGVYTRTASATSNIDTTTTNLVITVNAVAVPGAPQITSQSVVSLDESAGNNFDLFTLMATGDGAISWNISGGASAADYTINIGFNGYVFFELRRKTSADFDTAPQEFVQVTATGDVSPPAVQLITININEVVVPATVAPTITPTSGLSIQLIVGDSYSNPAWLWADDVVSDQDVDWSGDVVDANSVGTYNRLASATNNIDTTTQSYTVTVIAAVATVAPTITPTSGLSIQLIVGDSYSNPAWLWADDVVSDQDVDWSGDVVDANSVGTYNRLASATNNIDTTTQSYTVTVIAAVDVVNDLAAGSGSYDYEPHLANGWIAMSNN